MSNLQAFQSFGKKSGNSPQIKEKKIAVVYTRVSSKEQMDKNLSLDFQKKYIEEYAERNDIAILEYFGGTYESAKTDGRKEFARMQEYIKKNKGFVTHILVYTLDRFSRTGGGAIKLSEELREKYGVSVFAVTQPTDTSNPSGVFQQSIHFLFSQYDNQLRKQRAVAGMKEKFQRGHWVVKPPMGYDIIRKNGERLIVVNDEGKKLKKAFEWKVKGLKNEAILEKLRSMGLRIYKQKLSAIFRNPFYCGLMAHGMLDGKVIEGKHEKLISHDMFLKVNEINAVAKGGGVPHSREHNEVPLKVFMKCDACNTPMSGYRSSKYGSKWYYKCRTKGCSCNKTNLIMHELFADLLNKLELKQEFIAPLTEMLRDNFSKFIKVQESETEAFRSELMAIEKKIDTLQEKHYINGEISKEVYYKLSAKLEYQKHEISQNISFPKKSISNFEDKINNAVNICSKLNEIWGSSNFHEREKFQNLLFPEGIWYNKENHSFRTPKTNLLFSAITSLQSVSALNDKGQITNKSDLSFSVGRTGFEPATPWSQTKYSTELNYLP
jgi:site-specific DNA recombinase